VNFENSIALSICFGVIHALGLTEMDGKTTVWGWGANSEGQLTDGSVDAKDHNSPVELTFFTLKSIRVVKITCGCRNNAAISAIGELYMWGLSSPCGFRIVLEGDSTKIPTKINFLGVVGRKFRVLDIKCSDKHNLALCEELSEAKSVCFEWGSLKTGVGEPPVEIKSLSLLEDDWEVVSIGVGYHSCHCKIEKKEFFHLTDESVQEDKIDFLKEYLWI